MNTRFIEATSPGNWGKFLLGRFTQAEWARSSLVAGDADHALLRLRGWSPHHLLVVDLETGEGAMFAPSPSASPTADLEKHAIWVCPLFEPFLTWLYQQDLRDLETLPDVVELPNAPFAFAGYRRPGKGRTP